MSRVLVAVLVLSALLFPGLGLAAERFPPPEFSFDYQFPRVTVPAPRAPVFEWIDVLVLLSTLSVAAWLVLKKRSRLEIFLLTVFSLLYFGFYRGGCVCPIGAIQNVALAFGSGEYVLPVTIGLFFLLPVGFTLLFGRVFCSSVCPLGAAQEIVLLRPVKVPFWLERGLGMIPFFYLGAAAMFAWVSSDFLICRYDPFIAFFRLAGEVPMLIAGGVLLAIGVFVGRPYCRFLCPLGAILRVLGPLAKWRVQLGDDHCVNCHLCADACPYNAIRPPTEADRTRPPSTGRATLGVILVVIPLAIAMGALLGNASSDLLLRASPTAMLSARIYAEQQGLVEGTTEESEAFYALGQDTAVLHREAAEIARRFEVGSTVLGGFFGMVIGWQLLAVSLRRSRETYEIDPAACVSCGRCYCSCPLEVARKAGRAVNLVETSE